MAWAKLDDRYDDNPKVKRAWRRHPAAVGLHVMAVTHACRHELDGVVEREWVEEKLPVKRDRDAVVGALVECGLFEPHENGFLVHDFLDFNPSRAELAQRREKDRLRKASGGKVAAVPSDSARIPDGSHEDSPRPSRAPAGAGRDGTGDNGDGEDSVDARARTKRADQNTLPDELSPELAPVAGHVLEVLLAVHRERGGDVPTVRGVGLAIRRYEDRDHRAVAADLEHWATAGHGRNRPIKDWAQLYSNFLGRAAPSTPSQASTAPPVRRESPSELLSAIGDAA